MLKSGVGVTFEQEPAATGTTQTGSTSENAMLIDLDVPCSE
jgi:hypothetical protein